MKDARHLIHALNGHRVRTRRLQAALGAVTGFLLTLILLGLAFETIPVLGKIGQGHGWLPRAGALLEAVLIAGLIVSLGLLFRGMRASQRFVDAALKVSDDARLRAEALAETAPTAIYTVDDAGVIGSWNPACEAITGHPAADVLGRSHADVWRSLSGGEPILEDGEDPPPPLGRETTITAKGGARKTVAMKSDRLRDSRGRRIGTIVAFADISSLRSLEKHHRRFQELLRKSHIRHMVFDAGTLAVRDAASGEAEPPGRTESGERTRCFLDLVQGMDRDRFNEIVRPLHERTTDRVVALMDMLDAQGKPEPTEVHLRLDADGGHVYEAVAIDISQRSRIENELVASRKQLRLVLEGADLGLWDWDVRSNQVTYNERWAEMLGYKLEEIDGRLETWKELVHPDDLEPTLAALDAHLKGRAEAYETEHRMRHRSGVWIWVLDRGRITERDEFGRPLRVCGTHLDITNRKQMELERELLLRSTEESVKVLQGLIGVAQVIATSRGLDELLERSAELLPAAWTHSTMARGRILLDDAVYGARSFQPTPWRQTADVVVAGKVRGRVEVYYLQDMPQLDEGPFCNEERELIEGVASMLSGAVERYLAERALLEQSAALEGERANLQAIFDAAQVGFLLIDEALEVVKHNEVIAKALDTPDIRLMNSQPGNVIKCMNALTMAQGCGESEACDSCVLRGAVNGVIATGRPVRNVETAMQLLVEGQVRTFHFSLSASPVNLEGKPHALLSLVDLTESKAMEQQLAQGRKLEAVGQLAAGIAHEINTPTQFVSDSVHFLRDAFADQQEVLDRYRELLAGLPEDAGRDEVLALAKAAEEDADLEFLIENVPKSLDRSLEGLGRISRIVSAMKEFSHPGRTDQSQADLNEALQATLTIAKNEYKYVADVVTDFGDLPPVTCHVGELNQVFLNLLVNAAHAIQDAAAGDGERGTIRVRTRACGDMVEIAIEDTGPGIPPEVRTRVFEPFFTTKELGRGSGQGLAIARSIVAEKHGGTIEFVCGAAGGTTFTIRLPVAGVRGGPLEEAKHETVHPLR